MKKKIIRGNHAPYMNKTLRKAMMRRTQLRNKYYATKKEEHLNAYKKQRHFVSRLYKKEKKKFFNNIDVTNFTDNAKFWKNVNPLFTEKGPKSDKITLVKDNTIISTDKNVADTLNEFFKNAVTNLGLYHDNNFHNRWNL